MQTTILTHPAALAKEFARCCQEYTSLEIAVAWGGNPKNLLPFSLLSSFKGKIRATLGISYSHTHPGAIEYFMGLTTASVRIFRQSELFHPKVYLFATGEKFAVFVGSSNFTYGGFAENVEINTLTEGNWGDADEIKDLRAKLDLWHTGDCSFTPTEKWLTGYREEYDQALKRQRTHKIRTPPQQEDEAESSNWLRDADWNTYFTAVIEGLRQRKRDIAGYLDVLQAAQTQLPLPWKADYFKDLEKRRIIAGKGDHGWLGHIGASGGFMHILAKGTSHQWMTIVDSVNQVGQMRAPLNAKDFQTIHTNLTQLVRLGPTVKVWGRFLTLVRPDMYCTIASNSVRRRLSKTLGLPQAAFERPDGYVQLLKFIHASPWLNSPKPQAAAQLEVWNSRVAFMDAIYHDT